MKSKKAPFKAPFLLEFSGIFVASDAHGHDDVAVAVRLISQRAHLPGGLFVLQLDADRAIRGGAKKIQHVAGIKYEGDGIALEFFLDTYFGIDVFRARS